MPAVGDGFQPAPPIGGCLDEKATHPTPAAPSCPNTERPSWLLSAFHCARDHELRQTYGITCESYYRLLAQQGGVCAVCGRRPGKWRLAVDHDHDSGFVRGLCHHRCQRGITTAVVRYLADPPGRGLGLVVPAAKLRRLEAKDRAKRERAKQRTQATNRATAGPASGLDRLRLMTRQVEIGQATDDQFPVRVKEAADG